MVSRTAPYAAAVPVPLPPQPSDVPWPTREWPEGPVPDGVALEPLLDEVMDADGPLASTHAVVVVHRGRLVAERYGGELQAWGDQPAVPVERSTPLLSWSMAKSMLHAVYGMLVLDGLVSVDDPAPVPEWSDDDRRAITIEHLLEMRDGLAFAEDYVDAGVSDVFEMLFGSGSQDVAAYAVARPLAAPPGSVFSYSSGTTNVLSRIAGSLVDVRSYLQERLFDPIGMSSATATFDAAGTWVASSYVHATARDMARFGYLYLRDGVWEGERLLPDGWVDHARLHRSTDPDNGNGYGAHWWVVADDPLGSFWANGYEGQSILVCPGADLVVVRLGKTPAERYPDLRDWRRRVAEAFAGWG